MKGKSPSASNLNYNLGTHFEALSNWCEDEVMLEQNMNQVRDFDQRSRVVQEANVQLEPIIRELRQNDSSLKIQERAPPSKHKDK